MGDFTDIQIGDQDDLQLIIEHTHPIDNDGDPFTVYEICVNHKSPAAHKVWRLYKRFTAIYDLEKRMEPLCPISDEIALKKKRLVKNMDPIFIRQRTQEIQICFNFISASKAVRRSPFFREFLNPQQSPALCQVGAFHVIKEGYVFTERKLATGINSLKLGKLISISPWKRKWCVLAADRPWLYMYSTREDFAIPNTALDLKSCVMEVCPPKLSENGTVVYSLSISLISDGVKTKTVVVRVESLDDLTLWNAAISDLLYAKRPPPPPPPPSTDPTEKPLPPPPPPPPTHSQQNGSLPTPNGNTTSHIRHVKSANLNICEKHQICEASSPSATGSPARQDNSNGGGGGGSSLRQLPKLPSSGSLTRHKTAPARPDNPPPPPVPRRPHQKPGPGTMRELPPIQQKTGPADQAHSLAASSKSQNNIFAPTPPQSSPRSCFEQEPFQVLDEDDEDKMLSQEPRQERSGSIVISLAERTQKDVPVEDTTNVVTLPAEDLLPGESLTLKIPNVYHVHIADASTPDPSVKPLATCVLGTLFLTNFKLVFRPVSTKSRLPCPCLAVGCSVTIASIQQIDRFHSVSPAYGKFSCFVVRSKDFHDLRFNWVAGPSPSVILQGGADAPQPTDDAYPDDFLEPYIFHNYILNLFAFNKTWVDSFDPYTVHKFWSIYDQKQEFTRLGFPSKQVRNNISAPNFISLFLLIFVFFVCVCVFIQWRITEINKDFAYCNTYPELLCVPNDISDQELIPMFTFRSKGRIPTVVWANHDNGAALLRCGQPSVGMKSKRCQEDEKLMYAIGACNSLCKTVFILDARPRLNARANQFMGRGFERDKFYANCSINFLGIDNIHKMAESEAKIRKAVMTPGSDIRAQSAKWLQHISLLIASALDVVSRIEKGMSVIVHCSDGWDRTPQLSSLALTLLDPYHRTLDGFMVLIEKEWISFGHMFSKRVRQVPTRDPSNEQSPIFMQFIDCIRQMRELCPKAFQFNEKFLVTLLDELYAGRFGTFLFDSFSKRKTGKADETTVPLWLYIDKNRSSFIQPEYDPKVDLFHILLGYRQINATLWEGYFMRWKQYHNNDLGVPLRSVWRENLS